MYAMVSPGLENSSLVFIKHTFTSHADQISSSLTLAEYLSPSDYGSIQLSKEATPERICTLPTAPYIGILLLTLCPGVI